MMQTNDALELRFVKKLDLREEMEQKVATASAQIGDVVIKGLDVWKSQSGKLTVYWPKHWRGPGRSETVDLPAELRAEVEAEVITAYRIARKEAKERAIKEAARRSAVTSVPQPLSSLQATDFVSVQRNTTDDKEENY
jgi:hypothetical protein